MYYCHFFVCFIFQLQKPTTQSQSNSTRKHEPNTHHAVGLRSTINVNYDTEPSLAPQPLRKPDSNQPVTAKPNTPSLHTNPVSASDATASKSGVASHENRIIEMIERMERERKRQMDDLVERQAYEQRCLHETFLQQQQLFISQITERCTTLMNTCQQNVATQLQEVITAVSPMSRRSSVVAEDASIHPQRDSGGGGDWIDPAATDVDVVAASSSADDPQVKSIRRKFGISRRLFDVATASAANSPSSADNRKADDVNQQQSAEWRAATKINAAARGYLTRRLFRTEDVQTIVKVIRDTLLFVIDLHHESNLHVEEDLPLKRSLLKQVSCPSR